MKKHILIIFALLSINCANAQNKKAAATAEEYSYMSRGYKVQEQSGLEMKKGYTTRKPIIIDQGNYAFTYIALHRGEGVDAPFIGWIIKAEVKAYKNTFWYCIPQDNEDALATSFSQILAADEEMTKAFFISYAKVNQLSRPE
jgi:hypothetical protein